MGKLLTSSEASKYLGYSETSLRTSRSGKKLLSGVTPPVHIKIGVSVRYKVEDLDEWLNGLKEVGK